MFKKVPIMSNHTWTMLVDFQKGGQFAWRCLSKSRWLCGGVETNARGVETNFGGFETHFGGVETNFAGVETNFGGVRSSSTNVQSHVDHVGGFSKGRSIRLALPEQKSLLIRWR